MAVLMRSSASSAVAHQRPAAARPSVPMRAVRTNAVSVQALLTKLRPATKTVKAKDVAPVVPEKRVGLQLGFTKDNELFVGRAAMLGFAFSLVGELLTGKGALGQLGYEVFDDKIGLLQVDELVVGLILFNLVAAILPASGTFVPDEEVESRPAGALQDPKISILDWRKFFGVTGFGFTKENELFVGRVAQLGFAASLIGETLTGDGPLGQFDIETGISLQETEFGLAAFILFFFFAAINPGSGKFIKEQPQDN